MVSLVHRRSPVFRLPKPFLSKFITRSSRAGSALCSASWCTRHLLSAFGAAVENARMRAGELPLYSELATRLYSRAGQRGRVVVATTSTPSRQKCATWPMHKVTTGLIISQRVDERPPSVWICLDTDLVARLSFAPMGCRISRQLDVWRKGRARRR